MNREMMPKEDGVDMLPEEEAEETTGILKSDVGGKIKSFLVTPRRRSERVNSRDLSPSLRKQIPGTPRRSTRKSVKPVQDYEEIVSKRMFHAANDVEEKSEIESLEGLGEEVEVPQPKWTPAKVGRVSQKRGRKGRRGRKHVNNTEVHKEDEKIEVETNASEKSEKEVNEVKGEEGKVSEVEDVISEVFENAEAEEKVVENACEAEEKACVIQEGSEIVETHSDKIEEEAREVEETPMLIVLDEGHGKVEDDDVFASAKTEEDEVVASALNETFDTSDCIMLTENEQENNKEIELEEDVEKEDCQMQSLLISDDDDNDEESLHNRIPKIVLTTPKTTPLEKRSKAYRFPTPYRPKVNFSFNAGGTETEQEEQKTESQPATALPVVCMEPKEIVLRSIRKRSLSVCINGVVEKKKPLPRTFCRVTFNSPDNQTTIIEDLDVIIAKSVQQKEQTPLSANKSNITTRRKRSQSFDESSLMSNASKILKPGTPRKFVGTPQKPVAAIGPVRTKLPNFAAIHQKHFNKMENLVDHVQRKAERAKELSNSMSKLRTVSAQKERPELQRQNLLKSAEKPKAAKKINLTTQEKKATTGLKVPNKIAPSKIPTKAVDKYKADEQWLNPNLAFINPKSPKIIQTVAHYNAATVAKKPTKAVVPTAAQAKRVLRPMAQVQPSAPAVAKPALHLGAPKQALSKPPTASANNQFEDKLAARRQRHMEMFKGRTAPARKNGDHIRGVRSNRRFDLQMQHRRNLELENN